MIPFIACVTSVPVQQRTLVPRKLEQEQKFDEAGGGGVREKKLLVWEPLLPGRFKSVPSFCKSPILLIQSLNNCSSNIGT